MLGSLPYILLETVAAGPTLNLTARCSVGEVTCRALQEIIYAFSSDLREAFFAALTRGWAAHSTPSRYLAGCPSISCCGRLIRNSTLSTFTAAARSQDWGHDFSHMPGHQPVTHHDIWKSFKASAKHASRFCGCQESQCHDKCLTQLQALSAGLMRTMIGCPTIDKAVRTTRLILPKRMAQR